MAQSQSGSPAPEKAQKAASKAQKTRPTKILPTDRITFSRQLDLLRAFAAASGQNGKVVTNEEVADIVNMSSSTVSMANAFFKDAGFLRQGEGGYLPSGEVVAFNLAYQWNPDTASHKLSPLLRESWFAKAIMPKLAFRPLDEGEAIATLAEAAAAGPDYRGQLRLLLDYLEAAGLVQRDGNLIRLAQTGVAAATGGGMEKPPAPLPRVGGETPATLEQPIFAQPTQGVVQFQVNVKVNMAELAGWEADRITAFFAGIAQVLAAKRRIEEKTQE